MRTFIAAVGGITLVTAGIVPAATIAAASPHHPAVVAHHGPATPKHAQGDIDGDGRSDLVANTFDAVHVTYTSANPHSQVFALPDGEWPLQVATGDFNGDGFADLAVGSEFSLPDGPDGNEDGEVFVYYGSSTGIDPSHYASFPGPAGAAHEYGEKIWALNLNNDGATDLVVDDSIGSNQADVLYGSSGGLTTTGASKFPVKDIGGVAVGDINHDGIPDLVVGSPDAGKSKTTDHGEVFVGSEGIISVFFGTHHGFAAKPQTIHGIKVGVKYGSLGSAIAIAKVNGDKYPDVVAGADNITLHKHADGVGGVAVLYGSKTGLSASKSRLVTLDTSGVPGKAISADQLGGSVAASDINGDGYADVIAGAPQNLNGRNGEFLVLRGSKHGVTTMHSQLLKLNALPISGGAVNNGSGYGSQVVAFNPTSLRFGAVAVSAPMFSQGGDYGTGLVDVWVGSKHGLTPSRATREISPTEKEYFGQALAS